MDINTKSRPVMATIVAAVLIAIPSFVVIALYRVRMLWSDAFLAEMAKATEQAPEQVRASGASIDMLCQEGLPEFAEFCSTSAMVSYALAAAYACLVAAILLVALPWLARKYVGNDRSRLVKVFGPVVKMMTVSVGLLVAVQALIGTYAFYVWEVEETGRFHPKLLVLGLAGVLVGLGLLWAALKRLRIEPSFVFGVAVSPKEQPRLAGEVTSIAEQLGANAPDNLVVGIEPSFFVTSAPVKLLDGTQLNGRTMFMSLPLMRLFRPDEFRAVVGHELTHFKGADTEYSQKFAPAYARLSEALTATADEGMFQSIAAMPLAYTLREFAETERTIGRQRELIADQGAAQVSAPSAIVRALVKVAMHGPMWPSLVSASESKLAEGQMFKNLSEIFAGSAVDQLPEFDREKLREVLQQYRMAHPIDTHPTLAERAKALQCPLDAEIDNAFVADGESAAALFDNLEAIEESATLVQHRVAVATGRVVIPQQAAG